MEALKNIPKWFWIALGLIIVATVVAIMYANRKAAQTTTEIKSTLQSQPLKDEIKAEVKQDIFDILSSIHLSMGPDTTTT